MDRKMLRFVEKTRNSHRQNAPSEDRSVGSALRTHRAAVGGALTAVNQISQTRVHGREGAANGGSMGSQGAAHTSVLARGVLSVGIPRFLNKSQHFTVHLFRSWIPSSTRCQHFLSSLGAFLAT